MFTDDTAHNAAVNTKAALESCGHTVTQVAVDTSADVSGTDVSGYDAVVVVRCLDDLAGTIEAAVNQKWITSGASDGPKPLLMAAIDPNHSTGINASAMAAAVGFADRIRFEQNSGTKGRDLNVTDVSHPITAFLGSTGTYQVMVGTNWVGTVPSGDAYAGTSLAVGPAGDTGHP